MKGALAERDASVWRCLGRFCEHQGIASPRLVPRVVEAFGGRGLAGRAASTKGTYRSVLRRSGAGPAGAGDAFRGSPAQAPYSAEERAELLSVAASQRRSGGGPRRWLSWPSA